MKEALLWLALPIVAAVFFGWLILASDRERKSAPCETFASWSIENVPARCVGYFREAGAR